MALYEGFYIFVAHTKKTEIIDYGTDSFYS